MFTDLFKDPGDSPPKDGPVPKDETAKVNKEASNILIELLDFSSGSEEDEQMQGLKKKASSLKAVDSNMDGNAATGPGRMSLLHYGFSRLLERVKGNPEIGDGGSPSAEESLSDTDAKDQGNIGKGEGTSKTGIGAVCPAKLRTKTWDLSSVSDREDEGSGHKRVSLLKESDEAVKKSQGLKGWTSKKTIVDEVNDEKSSSDKKPYRLKTTVPTVHCFDNYSDESDDFDLEKSTWGKKNALNAHERRHDCTRKRQSSSVRNRARSKHTDDIETFTSSEDEHTTPKKGRSRECHFTSPQMERSRVGMPKDRQIATTDRTKRHKAVSFTSVKSQISPSSKEKDGTIDSVLGKSQLLF